MKLFRSLTARLIFSFLFIVALISALTFGYTYRLAKEALLATMQDELKAVASTTASQIDGDIVESLNVGDDGFTPYLTVQNKLLEMRKNDPDVRYSYIMRPHNGNVEFVVDDTYGKEKDAALIGDVYENTEDPTDQAQDIQEILKGITAPTAEDELFTDKWGTFLSGFAPIYDSQGKAVAILGIDMTATDVLAKEHFIGRSIYLIFGIAFAVSLLLVTLLALSVSRDIKKINEIIRALMERKNNPGHEIKRLDELGELAKSVELMEGTIRSSLSGDFLHKL